MPQTFWKDWRAHHAIPNLPSRWVLLPLVGAILFYQLILPPVAGLADNGDFVKVIGRFGLFARVNQTYQYADTKYQFHPERTWVGDFLSVEIPLARASIWLNSLVTSDGAFDIRMIGIVHSALFLAAIWCFLPLLRDMGRGVQWLICGLTVFVYCDMMYVTPLNSFYMDEPAYLFLLLAVVFYLRLLRWRQKQDGALLIVCAFLCVAAKTQHALTGFWIALLFAVTAKYLSPVKTGVWYATAALLILESGAMIRKAQPADYSYDPLYNITFETILTHSDDVTRTLKELGLDDSYRMCIGKKSFLPGSGMDDHAFRQRFFRQYSFGKLAMFYIEHPLVALRTVTFGLSQASDQHAFGNFDIATGYPPATESRRFAWWSDIKRRLFRGHGGVLLFAFVMLSSAMLVLLSMQRARLPVGAVSGGICLVGLACTEMITATLCDSMDIVRHSMLFLALFDTIVLVSLYLLCSSLVKPSKTDCADCAS